MLRHSSDAEPGITRKRMGHYWAYFDAEGKRITDRDEIDRLNAIGLPPAYADAWFCADAMAICRRPGSMRAAASSIATTPNSERSVTARNIEGLLEFGKSLPRLRRRVEQDLKGRELTREAVLAAVVRLLDIEHIRIGNEEYARTNKSFGATTLSNRHLKRKGQGLTMRFTGKHGIVHEVKITDTNLKRIVQALPGTAGPDAVPICERRRRAEAGHVRATSTTTSRKRRAATSRPSISAPGARASSRSSRC